MTSNQRAYQLVSIYLDSKGSVLVLPNAKSPQGLHVTISKPIFLNPPFSPEDLGEACQKARALYNSEVPNTDWSRPSAEMIATGAKTWGEFSRKRKLVHIDFFPNEVIITPTCRDLRGGYKGLDKLHLSNEGTSLELGSAILKAFEKSAI